VWTLYHLWSAPAARLLTLGIAGASFAATLLTPYGPGLLLFLLETVRIGRGIQEWLPIWHAMFAGAGLPWLLTSAGVVALVASRFRPRTDRLAVILTLAVASERTMRLVPFYVAITALYAVPSLTALAATGWGTWSLRAPSRVAVSLSLLPILAVVPLVHRPIWTSTRQCLSIEGEWIPDLEIAASLKDAAPAGRIVTHYGWGQYVIWHVGPRLLVSYDGRRETVYTPATDLRQVEIERGSPEGLAFLDKARPEYVWLSPSKSARVREWLLRQEDYRIDLQTASSFLAVRSDLPIVPAAARASAPCFPG
jgi:hypothetical protein